MCYDILLDIAAEEERGGVFTLTNRRIAVVLNLMGFDFSHQENLAYVREYDFDIVVETQENRTVIGYGSLKNNRETEPLLLGTARLISPRCDDASAIS